MNDKATSPSGQSASSGAAGCSPDADQGDAVENLARAIQEEFGLHVAVWPVIERMIHASPVVARRPADPSRILEAANNVVKAHDNGTLVETPNDSLVIELLRAAVKEFESSEPGPG